MKKEILAKIKAIANQMLVENDDRNTLALKNQVGELYEQLSVLHYLETQIDSTQSEATNEEPISAQSKDSKSYREENWFKDPEPVPQPEHKEDLVEPLMEKIKDLVAQMPSESQRVDKLLAEVLPQKKYMKNDLEEFAANYQETPTFERKQEAQREPEKPIYKEKQATKGSETPKPDADLVSKTISTNEKPKSLNDTASQGLKIGLNDRLAFIKHLFDGRTEDYTRVLSQISTMNSYEEAATFIKGKVKPDYNYWMQKDEYSERFMAIVEKSFA